MRSSCLHRFIHAQKCTILHWLKRNSSLISWKNLQISSRWRTPLFWAFQSPPHTDLLVIPRCLQVWFYPPPIFSPSFFSARPAHFHFVGLHLRVFVLEKEWRIRDFSMLQRTFHRREHMRILEWVFCERDFDRVYVCKNILLFVCIFKHVSSVYSDLRAHCSCALMTCEEFSFYNSLSCPHINLFQRWACIHAFTYIYIHVHVHVYVCMCNAHCACVCTWMHEATHMKTNTIAYSHAYDQFYHVDFSTCWYIHAYACWYIHAYTWTKAYIFMYTFIPWPLIQIR